MPIVSAPLTRETYSPTAQNEQELAYELLNETAWTAETYLAFSERLNRSIELSEGRLVVLPMPFLTHQAVLVEWVSYAKAWSSQGARGKVLLAPHPIRLWEGKYREPDGMVWLTEHRDRLGERESGPPDLALEIVSPRNEAHDFETKFNEYAKAGIAEYWIIDPATRRVSVYRLEGSAYRLVAHYGAGQQARSVILPGFEVAVDSLFVG